MGHYQQLTYEQRCQIYRLKQEGLIRSNNTEHLVKRVKSLTEVNHDKESTNP